MRIVMRTFLSNDHYVRIKESSYSIPHWYNYLYSKHGRTDVKSRLICDQNTTTQ